MKTLFLIVFILINAQILYAQLQGQEKIDSLLKELPKMKEDTNRVNLLEKISFLLQLTNPDEGLKYGKQGLKLAEEIDWELGKANCYNSLGANKKAKSDYSKALEYFHKALKINEEIGSKRGIATNLANIGLIYNNQSDHPKALEYFGKALKIHEELGNKGGIASILGNIGIIYKMQSDYPKALEYFHKALKIDEELNNKNGVAIHLGNIGIIYFSQSNYQKALEYDGKAIKILEELGNKGGIASILGNIGNIYASQSNYPKALKYYHKALKINEEIGSKGGIATNLGNMGNIYSNQSDYPKALEYYHEALNYDKELGDKYGIANGLGNIGELYLTLAQDSIIENSENKVQLLLNKELNLNKAIEYSKKAIDLSNEIRDLHQQTYFLYNLSQAYELKGDFKKAYEVFKEHKELNDSIFSIDKSKEIANLENERNQLEADRIASEKARIDAEKIAQRNRLQYLGIGAMVIGFGIILIITGRMKLKDWISRALVFVSLIFLFEFMLVLLDPWTDEISEGIPLFKFSINMIVALIIFPIHQYLEKRVSKRIIKIE